MREYRIGKIVNTHALKGEVKIYPYADYPERLEEIDYFFIGEDDNKKWEMEKVRYQGNMVIAKIKGIDSIDEAEKFRDKMIYIDSENIRDLEDEEYMIKDLIGLDVYVDEEIIGKVKDVLQYSANDVYVIKLLDKREILIPAVHEFVPTIDLDNNKMVVKPIKGMID